MEFDSNSWVLWVGVIAVGLHVIEEYAEGWLAWANFEAGSRLGVTITPADFFLGSAMIVFAALASAAIGWWAPAISLAIPAYFVINAVFFHMVPSASGDRLTPGTLSAVLIYLPVATWMFWAASDDGRLGLGTVAAAFILGAALAAFPIAVLVLREKIGWDEETVAAATSERAAAEARRQAAAERRAAEELAAATPPPVDLSESPAGSTEYPADPLAQEAGELEDLDEASSPIEGDDDPDDPYGTSFPDEADIELVDDDLDDGHGNRPVDDDPEDEPPGDETAILPRD